MKKIGIMGAMEVEVKILKTKVENLKIETFGRIEFYTGTILGKEIVLARCGIGKVNASMCTQLMIDKFGVDAIINTGVAGAIGFGVDVLDVVVSTELLQHDFDTSFAGDKVGVVCDLDVETFKANEKLIEVAKEGANEVLKNSNVFTGIIATGDQFIGDRNKKNFIRDTFNAMCCEMEGGAIAHVCYLNDVPFVVIRSISDNADDSADIAYPEFVAKAAKDSSEIVEYLLQNI